MAETAGSAVHRRPLEQVNEVFRGVYNYIHSGERLLNLWELFVYICYEACHGFFVDILVVGYPPVDVILWVLQLTYQCDMWFGLPDWSGGVDGEQSVI